MPESNERQIEKLLKSAGARRREQAGTPEMHPATREMLQTEVRRQYGDAPLRKRGAFGMLLRWLPRLAVFVALGACAWLLWFRETTDASLQLARKQEVSEIPADEAVQLSSKPEGRAAREPLAVGGEWLPADEAAELQPATPASSPAPAAAPPQRSMSVRSQPADEGSKSVVGADFFKADRQAMYMGTAAAESEQKDHVAADTDGALGALMESNRAEARSATGPETSARKARPQTAVLQNFTIVNEGRVVRLIDADGSTYEGVLRPVNEFGAKPTKSSPVLSVAPDSSTSAISSAEGVVLQNYMVVVSGTNRSLNQAVRFEGNLELTERQVGLGRNFFSNTIPPVAGKQAAKLPAQEAQLTPGHLRGNAVLDDGQNVKVDALLLAR